MSAASRIWAFIALCAVAAGLTGFAVWRASGRTRPPAQVSDAPAAVLTTVPARPYLLVRSTAIDQSFRRLVGVPLAAASGPGFVTPLECERAYFAAGRGVCLTIELHGIASKHMAQIFDDRFTRLHTVELTGIPSRARISPDGRRAGVTVFEQGHSYAEDGFSTKTSVLDTATGRLLGDLEQFQITRDGRPFKAVDFNFWGLTFKADGNQFYATLGTGGRIFLVEGDIDARTARVVREGIECPSLSPDNTRIAYKKRVDRGVWQLRVLDLRTETDVPLTRETRSVDDQVDWLDNDRIMYHISGERGADIYVLRVDGTEDPQTVRQYAYSPSVVR